MARRERTWVETHLLQKLVTVGILIALAYVIFVGLVGGSSTPEPPATPVPVLAAPIAAAPVIAPSPTVAPCIVGKAAVGFVGRCQGADGIQLTANTVTYKAALSRYDAIASDSVYLLVDVSIDNHGQTSIPYSDGDFKVRDPQHYEYPPAIVTVQGALQEGNLTPGQTVRGVLAFAVPRSGNSFTLVFQPTLIFKDYPAISMRIF